MIDYCAFSNDHTCPKWMDYKLTGMNWKNSTDYAMVIG